MKMGRYRTLIPSLIVIALLCSAFCGICGARTITANIGDSIPLNGTVQLVDTVYLFVTGPGIPPGGSRMDNSNAPVVTGEPDTFTQVIVENERWAYTWNTGRVSGGLAPGSHTVYVSTQPAAANALSGVRYGEIEVMLRSAVTTATLDVESVPGNAEIYLNEKYSGNSPRVFPGLAPGAYTIRLEKQGYAKETGSVTLAAGDELRFSRTLTPLDTPTAPLTTMSTQARKEEGGPVPLPTTAPLNAGIMVGALVLAVLLCNRP